MFFLLAHGNDPQPLPWFVLLADAMVAIVAMGLAAFFSRNELAPIFREMDPKKRPEVAGWVAVALGMLIATGAWVTRESLMEVVVPVRDGLKHLHSLGNGGQVAMWGDYHAELARNVTGEYRMFFTDAYQRPISSEYFEGRLVPRNGFTGELDESGAVTLVESLGHDYRFAITPRSVIGGQAQMKYPGGTINFNFLFDGKRGHQSLNGWCGPSGRH